MIREDLPKHFQEDVVFAFGKEGGKLWESYCATRDRITAEVDAGNHPELDGREVGVLCRIVKDFPVDDPMDFRMALQRIKIDKDYYGSAKIGMGDLLAIRSIESFVVTRVGYKIQEALSDRPLIKEVVGSIRHKGHSKGINHDIRLAEEIVSTCLLSVVRLPADENECVSIAAVMNLAHDNNIKQFKVSR